MSIKVKTDHDLSVGSLTLGARPGLVIIDMSLGFTQPSSPLGGDFTSEVAHTKTLLDVFRNHRFPVFYTTVVYHNEQQAQVFRKRLPDLNILQAKSKWVEIDPQLSPAPNEPIIEKCWASGFFGTDLHEQLKQQNVDSIVVVGLTTSGCVRATAVDALQHDYPVVVVPQACGDRNMSAHEASLHDINAKYGLVLSLDELCSALAQI
ncbi:isochorismatase family protein [Paraglaciecola chathamensis]|uniref:isochorismatase family protein n=1 Tax=Paraglaciecola chathamensis TaxID=368405 RepID=UPI002704CF3B|nr:isochorismatase family protein [Paraglaciecola chathamensis]MDO6839165.1 isochorismatase family protein [Paraglaciecola chathamensis]